MKRSNIHSDLRAERLKRKTQMITRRDSLKFGIAAGAALMLPGCTKSTNERIRIGTDNMKTLGMIGGTSWHSTIDYYRHINQMVSERRGSPPVNPPLLMYSLNVDLMRRNDWDEINQAYLDIAKTLQNAGAEAILICANTPHKVCPFVEPKLDIPIIHIADATAEEAKKLGLANLALLGTRQVMEEDFIRERLHNKYQIRTQTPDQQARGKIHTAITEELTRGILQDTTKGFFLSEMSNLKKQGIDGVILGCTELPMLIKGEDFDLPLLDTTYLHAKMAVDFILS
jgi:aspartate racemase